MDVDSGDQCSSSGMSSKCTRDRYGFAVPTPYCSLYRDYQKVYDLEEEQRAMAWEKWISQYGSLEDAMNQAKSFDGNSGNTRNSVAERELALLVRAGIPRKHRAGCWKAFLFPREKHADFLETYVELVDQMMLEKFAEDIGQIDKDLHRTFPNHDLTNTKEGKDRLRRVLGAYAVRNPVVGYCQGLNFIAATFLLVFTREGDADDRQSEAAAFWCFVSLVEDILTGYFDPMMINQQVDGLVFEQLVREILPNVSRHFDDVSVHVPTAIAGWFLVAFVNSLPSESTVRVWDALFLEKSAAVLFRLGLALLEMYQVALLECKNDGDCYMLIQALGPITFDATGIIELMENFYHVKDSALMVYRVKYAPGVTKVMEKMFSVSGASSSGNSSAVVKGSSRNSSKGLEMSRNNQKVHMITREIEQRLGILRLHHNDELQKSEETDRCAMVDADNLDSLRRTQSALIDCTPGIILQGRNERLQQQLRINLLAMRTFIPDMKLLQTALHIAAKHRRDDAHDAGSTSKSHITLHNSDLRGMKDSVKDATVPRRFTDGGALMASPFRNAPAPNLATPSRDHNLGIQIKPQCIPLEKLKNVEAIRDGLAREVSDAVSLLSEISASNNEHEVTVQAISQQLSKVQEEIEHKVSVYEALFTRTTELQEQTNAAEFEYRKWLTANNQLVDSWKYNSKEIKRNDITLKKLMDLAESSSTSVGGENRSREPSESPTKKMNQRFRAMVNRKFTK
jgi:hypothetical protein